MAERRMFAKSVIDSDTFLNMPLSTQALYFQLALRADDDGFLNNSKTIQRFIGASKKDFENLVNSGFIYQFDNGVTAIKHWKIHNLIQKDRYKETAFKNEKSLLILDNNNLYALCSNTQYNAETKCIQVVSKMDTECIQNVSKLDTECKQNVNTLDTQVSIGKDSIGKNSITTSKKESTTESLLSNAPAPARDISNINILETNNRRGKLESYDDIFGEFQVSNALKSALIEFIRHCQLNKATVTNDKLKDLIVRLDFAYGNDDSAKITSVLKARNSGFLDIPELRNGILGG